MILHSYKIKLTILHFLITKISVFSYSNKDKSEIEFICQFSDV